MAEAPNPFTPEKSERLAFRFPQGQTWETLMARLAAQHYVGADRRRAGLGQDAAAGADGAAPGGARLPARVLSAEQ